MDFAAALSLSSASESAALAGRSARRSVATIKMLALRIGAASSVAGSHAAAEVASPLLYSSAAAAASPGSDVITINRSVPHKSVFPAVEPFLLGKQQRVPRVKDRVMVPLHRLFVLLAALLVSLLSTRDSACLVATAS